MERIKTMSLEVNGKGNAAVDKAVNQLMDNWRELAVPLKEASNVDHQ